jgi:Flp pilus assembly pilin Flp
MVEYTQRFCAWAQTRMQRDEGQTLVEYSLIIALVSVGLIVALGLLRDDIDAVFTRIGAALDGAAPAPPAVP